MLMAARKLQGIGLVLLVLIFAMTVYLLSVNVAATRSQLAELNRDIAKTKNSIRYLESEFAVRASLRQLERWNVDSFGYSAPLSGQYLAGEAQLASLERIQRGRGTNEVAPVLMAMVSPVDMSNPAVEVAQHDGAAVRSDAAPADVAQRHRAKIAMLETPPATPAPLQPAKRDSAAPKASKPASPAPKD